jgi:FemAB-related protein (PEP-CTERM system-associated)
MKIDSAALCGADARALSVREAGEADAARWDTFVECCPEATFFHRYGWKTVLESVFRHRARFLIAERGAEIVGVLPLAEVRSVMFGRAVVSLPFCVYGGAAVVEAPARARLHEAACELARKSGAEHLELRNREVREPAWPRQDLYVTFRREILADAEANMLAIPRKQRAMVRKGIKNGLIAEIDGSTDRFFGLYASNVHRHGTPALPRRYFDALRQIFKDDCELLVVVDAERRPVSAVLSFYFRDEVLPYYAGDHKRAPHLAANDFKYWELMRRACERGLRVFDFGRSKRGTGSFDFKQNWGFEPVPLAYEHRLFGRDSIPQNNPSNPKYRAFIGLWRRLPIGVANAVGPWIVRGLG